MQTVYALCIGMDSTECDVGLKIQPFLKDLYKRGNTLKFKLLPVRTYWLLK